MLNNGIKILKINMIWLILRLCSLNYLVMIYKNQLNKIINYQLNKFIGENRHKILDFEKK